MTTGIANASPARWWALPVWALILIGLPALIAWVSGSRMADLPTQSAIVLGRTAVRDARPDAPPPPVEPMTILEVAPETAREINAAVPLSTAPNPAARPFRFDRDAVSLARATDCLAAAQLYEAGDDPAGQKAVAQVVLNRLRHPAFPKTVCGVVFQGSERVTGCQFTFTCDGALARTPSPAAWQRARDLAARMLSGSTDPRVGLATHYHTDWVVPYWSASLDKITAVDTHLFFRWKGWWGTPPAFRGAQGGAEPEIIKLAFLSPAHRTAMAAAAPPEGERTYAPPDFSDLGGGMLRIGTAQIGDRFGPARLTGINSAGNAFLMLVDASAEPGAIEALAKRICSGRAECRLLGWTRAADTPNRFPVPSDMLQSMSYAYLRSAASGVERSLFNCREFAGLPAASCMRDRTPAS